MGETARPPETEQTILEDTAPTQAKAIRKLGAAYNRTRLTQLVKKVFGRWLRWTR